jgi:branched-chain amino acid transport system substrate-binding protein
MVMSTHRRFAMTQKNDTATLMVAFCLTVTLVGGGLWSLGQRWSGISPIISWPTAPGSPPPAATPEERISLGERPLILADAPWEKQAGVTAYGAKQYGEAIAQFQAALQKHRNDPETLIYLNNAKAASGTLSLPAIGIGVSVPIGSNLNVAQEILRGVAQAQDEVNRAGGIQGRALTVAIANDENDPDLAKQIAAQFVQSNVVAVVGHNASNASLAAAPIYQAAGLVMISPTSFANGLSGLGNAIFRTIPAIRFMAEPLAHYAIHTARKTRLAVCADTKAPDNLSFRDELTTSFLTQGGQMVTLECDFADPAFNPAAAIAQAVSRGADSLLLAPHVDRIESAIAVARANKGRLTLFASQTLYTMQTLKSGQGDVNGVVLPIPWHPSASTGNFLAQARQFWGGTVNWRTATAYDATRAIITGLQHASRREDLAQALHGSTFTATGAGGKIAFSPTGDRIGAPVLVQVQAGGPTGYDFVPLK